MKNMKRLFKAGTAPVTPTELIHYPEGSLGLHLGKFLRSNYKTGPAPDVEDVFRLLLTSDASNKEEIGMHYYLSGNGDNGLRRLMIMGVGAVCFPHMIIYFCRRYRDGRKALRFFDLDHYRMLHLPIDRIKDAFLIR